MCVWCLSYSHGFPTQTPTRIRLLDFLCRISMCLHSDKNKWRQNFSFQSTASDMKRRHGDIIVNNFKSQDSGVSELLSERVSIFGILDQSCHWRNDISSHTWTWARQQVPQMFSSTEIFTLVLAPLACSLRWNRRVRPIKQRSWKNKMALKRKGGKNPGHVT